MPAKPVTRKTTPQAKARAAYQKIPTRTPADDPGRYTKVPHDQGDLLITPDAKGRTKLGGALQRDLLYWIERHTWGRNTGTPTKIVRPEYAKLSLSQLAKLCGSDRRTVARALADMTARGIIEARDRTGCGATVAKMYKATPERWRKAPYYEPKAMEDAAEDEDDPEEDGGEAPVPEALTNEPERTVDPGRVSKPQAVAVSPSKGAPAVAIRLVYRSVDLPFPVAFKAHPGRNGRVQISCRATAPQFFANPSPPEIPATVEDTQVSTYSAFLNPFVLKVWGKAADNTLINRVVTAANGAPVAVFERVVNSKFRGSRKAWQSGILIELAGDAARAHKAERAEAWRAAAEEARQRPQYSAAELAEFERIDAEQTAKTSDEALAALAAARCSKCNGTGRGKERWSNVGGVYGPHPTKCGACNGTGEAAAK